MPPRGALEVCSQPAAVGSRCLPQWPRPAHQRRLSLLLAARDGRYRTGTCPGSQWHPGSALPARVRPVNHRSALLFSAPFPGTVSVLFVPPQLTLKCFKLLKGPSNTFSQAYTLTLVDPSNPLVKCVGYGISEHLVHKDMHG